MLDGLKPSERGMEVATGGEAPKAVDKSPPCSGSVATSRPSKVRRAAVLGLAPHVDPEERDKYDSWHCEG